MDASAQRATKRFPWLIYVAALVVIALITLAPVGSVAFAGLVANSHGCQLDEGSVHPCVIVGKDYGETLYTLGVLGWLMLITLPAGALAFLVWLIIVLVHWRTWRRRLNRG
ncbi:MAG: hypothetical protein M3032_05975 [Verrucomicrobiota bacterium]|nr:hypothetical protein [Verrucomicrobiota bacterium]